MRLSFNRLIICITTCIAISSSIVITAKATGVALPSPPAGVTNYMITKTLNESIPCMLYSLDSSVKKVVDGGSAYILRSTLDTFDLATAYAYDYISNSWVPEKYSSGDLVSYNYVSYGGDPTYLLYSTMPIYSLANELIRPADVAGGAVVNISSLSNGITFISPSNNSTSKTRLVTVTAYLRQDISDKIETSILMSHFGSAINGLDNSNQALTVTNSLQPKFYCPHNEEVVENFDTYYIVKVTSTISLNIGTNIIKIEGDVYSGMAFLGLWGEDSHVSGSISIIYNPTVDPDTGAITDGSDTSGTISLEPEKPSGINPIDYIKYAFNYLGYIFGLTGSTLKGLITGASSTFKTIGDILSFLPSPIPQLITATLIAALVVKFLKLIFKR